MYLKLWAIWETQESIFLGDRRIHAKIDIFVWYGFPLEVPRIFFGVLKSDYVLLFYYFGAKREL